MKRLFVLSAMCILMMLSANKTTAQVVASGTTGACTWALSGASSNYTLTISGTGAMDDYDPFEDNVPPWYEYQPEITTLDIQQGVTTIGDFAFFECTALTSATVPNSVITIGNSVFLNCLSLTTITIGNSVTEIGYGAFIGCFGLTAIDVDEDNPAYSSVDGVLFNKLQNTLWQYPSGKTGSYTIPNSVTTIGNYAFWGCTNLTSIAFPNSLTAIGAEAFVYCFSLITIDVDEDNPVYSSIDGVLFNKLHDTLWLYPSGRAESYIIPNSATTIADYAFSYCSGLTSVTIGNMVTAIGEGAFEECYGLTEIYVKAMNPPALGEYVFPEMSADIPVYVCGFVDGYRASAWGDYFFNILPDSSCNSGIAGSTLKDVTLYPNPATDKVTILLPENSGTALFTLFDMQGKALIRKEISNGEAVSVSALAVGIYIYNVRTEKESYMGKLTVSD